MTGAFIPPEDQTARANKRAHMTLAARQPVGSLTCSCAAGSSLAERKEPDHWAAGGEVSKNSRLAYVVPVATRERPASEGGARENPLCLRNTARMGHFLPLVTQPNRPFSVHTCTSIRHRHKNALEAKQAAYLKRAKSTKKTHQASHEGGGGWWGGKGLRYKSEQKTPLHTAASSPFLHQLH